MFSKKVALNLTKTQRGVLVNYYLVFFIGVAYSVIIIYLKL